MELQQKIDELNKKLSNPNTPQGEVESLKWKLHDLKHKLNIFNRENFEKKKLITCYGSDDYCGCSVGELSFYFGYEVTMCPVKSHKTDDDCYEKDCDKREWCLQVMKGDEEILKIPESEFCHPDADCIERKLICGIMYYLLNN